MIDIYYQNVRGLRTKTVQFKRNIQLYAYQIVLLTETWLLDGISNEELFSDRYSVWRRDRDYSGVGQTRGGGVLIAVRNDLASHARPEWHSTAEDIWVSIGVGPRGGNSSTTIHIGCIYLCPQNQGLSLASQLSNFSDKALSACADNPYDKFIIAGDFNLSDILWQASNDSNHLTPLFRSTNINHIEIQDLMNLCNLSQFNNNNNHLGGLLDLVFSNDEVTVLHCTEPLVEEDAYHPALICQPKFIDMPVMASQSRCKYLYNKGDFIALCSELDNLNWQNLLSCGTVDEAVDLFTCILSSLRNKYVPSKCIHPSKYPAWYSSALIKILKEKNKVHRKYRTYGNRADFVAFNVLRKRVKKVEQECYTNYIDKTESSIRENPKAFWSYINANKKHNSYPSSMSFKNNTLTSGEDICDAFANFFNSNFLKSDPAPTSDADLTNINGSCDVSPASIYSTKIDHYDVLKALKTIDCNKSAGPDGLHPILISKCAYSLTFPISFLFDRSVKEGVMPKIWKTAFVTPIHKKGSKREIINYRPISKLCVLAKVLEKVIHQQVYAALKHTFIPQQHGFLKGRSTTSNLITFTDDLSSGMQSGGQIDAIYTDYTKAFDRIDHLILLTKLQSAGIHGDLLRWFSSYITDRCQTVVLNGFSSQSCYSAIPSGVPQGSILGPLLFTLFINDIDKCFIHSKYLLFADDMKIYKTIDSFNDCVLLQQDLDRLQDYCFYNKLELNVSKCSCITFSRSRNLLSYNYTLNQQSLERTDYIRDLGVIIDSKLLFDRHIDSITSKATKTLGFIVRSTKHFELVKSLKILYCSLIRSQLEYASQAWNPQYEFYINKIERIQKKFLKILNYKHRLRLGPDYTKSCHHHHLLPLTLRREAADLTFLHNILNHKIDCSELLSRVKIQLPTRANTRRNYLRLHVDASSTNYGQNSFFNRTCNNFNRNYSEHTDLFMARPNYFKNNINTKFFNE